MAGQHEHGGMYNIFIVELLKKIAFRLIYYANTFAYYLGYNHLINLKFIRLSSTYWSIRAGNFKSISLLA